MPGHPRHQQRQITVTVNNPQNAPRALAVEAQTERDAIFRAGMALAARLLAANTECNPGHWIVNDVQDLAPAR